MLNTPSYLLVVDRDEIWRVILSFYKKALLSDSGCLNKELSVQFSKETGEYESIDAGAIKKEFFELANNFICDRLLEGDVKQGFIPKRLGVTGSIINYKVLGVLIGHGFVQCGVLFARFQTWVYSYVVNPKDTDLLKTIINEKNIPLNAGTQSLLVIIESLRSANTEEELDSVCSVPENMERINTTQWGLVDQICLKTKEQLITELIFDELVRKRAEQLNSIIDGIKFIGLSEYLKNYPDLMKHVFISGEEVPRLPVFSHGIENCDTKKDDTLITIITWFKEFVNECSTEVLKKLLQFCTSSTDVPVWGLKQPINIKFLPDSEDKQMPESNVCFHILSLPVVHTKKEKFVKYILIALEHECSGFSAVE